MGNAECDFERGRIFALFDCGDRLSGDADFFPQVTLRHFTGQKTQSLNVIIEWDVRHVQ